MSTVFTTPETIWQSGTWNIERQGLVFMLKLNHQIRRQIKFEQDRDGLNSTAIDWLIQDECKMVKYLRK